MSKHGIRILTHIAILRSSTNKNLPITEHSVSDAFRKRWSVQNEFDNTMRLDSTVHGRWVFNDLYKWSFDKKEDGRSRLSRSKRQPLIADMMKRVQGGRGPKCNVVSV